MRRTGRGWWAAAVDGAGPGTDYAFSLDRGPPRPDPRSPYQPQGVHGPSRPGRPRPVPLDGSGLARSGPVRLDSLRMSHRHLLGGWHLRRGHRSSRPSGRPRGRRHRVMPVAEFPGRWGWGYDGVDLFAPHHGYGGPDGLKRLVDAAHDRGLAVVMDVVYNHLGPAGNYLAEFGPYFCDRHQTNWGDAVNFDGPGQRRGPAFRHRQRPHVAPRLPRATGCAWTPCTPSSTTPPCHILESLASEVEALAAATGRPLFVIAESDLNDPRFVRSRDAGRIRARRRLGRRVASRPARHPHRRAGRLLRGLRTRCPPGEGPAPGLGVRRAPSPPHRQRASTAGARTGLGGNQFVVFTQNHDQVGNRAMGERSAALMSPGRLQVAAALLLTGPVHPDALPGRGVGRRHSVPVLHRPRRSRAGPGGQPRAGARSSPASAGDPRGPRSAGPADLCPISPRLDRTTAGRPRGLLDWYRTLIALRRELPALGDPRLDRVTVDCDEVAGWLVVRRGPATVAANLGGATATLPAPAPARLVLASHPDVEPHFRRPAPSPRRRCHLDGLGVAYPGYTRRSREEESACYESAGA